jgi:hypothetical protein
MAGKFYPAKGSCLIAKTLPRGANGLLNFALFAALYLLSQAHAHAKIKGAMGTF